MSIRYNDQIIAGAVTNKLQMPIASTEAVGAVKPDGTTIFVTADGTISSIGSAGGGTTNYDDLTNKPQINSVELDGNVTLEEIGIQPAGDYLTPTALENATMQGNTFNAANLLLKLNAEGKVDASLLPEEAVTIPNTATGLYISKEDPTIFNVSPGYCVDSTGYKVINLDALMSKTLTTFEEGEGNGAMSAISGALIPQLTWSTDRGHEQLTGSGTLTYPEGAFINAGSYYTKISGVGYIGWKFNYTLPAGKYYFTAKPQKGGLSIRTVGLDGIESTILNYASVPSTDGGTLVFNNTEATVPFEFNEIRFYNTKSNANMQLWRAQITAPLELTQPVRILEKEDGTVDLCLGNRLPEGFIYYRQIGKMTLDETGSSIVDWFPKADLATLFSNYDLVTQDELATVANSGDYTDLINTPVLADVATSGSYNDLIDLPTIPEAYSLPTASTTELGGVKVDGTSITISEDGVISSTATGSGGSGTTDYTDLTNKPQINSVELDGNKTLQDLGIQPAGDYLSTGDLAAVATSGSYNDLTDKPEAYSLPTASTTELGGVKVDGTSITVAADGTISAVNSGSGGSGGITEIPVATTEVLGGVKPDGETISVAADGTISATYGGVTVSYDSATRTLVFDSYSNLTAALDEINGEVI